MSERHKYACQNHDVETLRNGDFIMIKSNCDTCVYNVYDEDDGQYYCEVDMDEDDAARLLTGNARGCPYYQTDDEYAVVRHQM